jgi:hypothetical protein
MLGEIKFCSQTILYKDLGPLARSETVDQVNLSFDLFSALRAVGGKPAASVQFLLNPDSSARAI